MFILWGWMTVYHSCLLQSISNDDFFFENFENNRETVIEKKMKKKNFPLLNKSIKLLRKILVLIGLMPYAHQYKEMYQHNIVTINWRLSLLTFCR